jgi:hypothetical protein
MRATIEQDVDVALDLAHQEEGAAVNGPGDEVAWPSDLGDVSGIELAAIKDLAPLDLEYLWIIEDTPVDPK